MIHSASLCTLALYFTLLVLYMTMMWNARRNPRVTTVARGVLYGGVCFHSILMGSVFKQYGLSVFESGADLFLWVSWILALVFSFSKRFISAPIVGLLVIPLVIAFMGSSSYLMHGSVAVPRGDGSSNTSAEVFVSLAHSIPLLVVFATFAMLFIVSFVFLIIERRLRFKIRPYVDTHGISLQYLDTINRYLAQLGFIGLSLVISSGGMWAITQHKPLSFLDPSVWIASLVWVFLGVLLHVRMNRGWSPRRLALCTVVLTGGFLISVFGILMITGRITHDVVFS